MIKRIQILPLRHLLICLIISGSSLTGSAQNGNWFMRYETGFPATDLPFSGKNPVSGFNWGITSQVKNSPLQAGVNFTYLSLAHKDWRAPFTSGGTTFANAEFCSVSSSFAGEFLLRYERNAGKRIIHYAEAGIGLARLVSDHYVYQDNPDDKCEPITLHHSVISRGLAASASGGVGVLIKLLRLDNCCEAHRADLYLDLYGGGRKTNGTFVKYEGEGNLQTEAFNPIFFSRRYQHQVCRRSKEK